MSYNKEKKGKKSLEETIRSGLGLGLEPSSSSSSSINNSSQRTLTQPYKNTHLFSKPTSLRSPSPPLNRTNPNQNLLPMPGVSTTFLESMVHMGYIDDPNVYRKDSDNVSIKSTPSKTKKRNIFGFSRKKKDRNEVLEDRSQIERNNRLYGLDLSNYRNMGGEGMFGIDLSLNPQDMEGIVNNNLSNNTPPENEIDDQFKINLLTGNINNNWKPPESWNTKRKPSISTLDDEVFDQRTLLDPTMMYCIRIYRKNDTFVTIPCNLNDRTEDIALHLAKKFHVQDPSSYELFVYKFGKGERMLYPLEKPVKLLSKLLIDSGYASDEILDIIREDNSYLCKFIYREGDINPVIPNDPTPTSDSENVQIRKQNLETVPVYLYKLADRIKSLDLSQNLLMDFPLDFVQLCISLTKLKLVGNEYEKVPDSIYPIKGLKWLDLSNNKIGQLESGHLHLISDLDKLMLSNNQLKRIPESYSMLTKLTILDLSNNCLEVFPLPISNLAKLRYLNLSYNHISEIPALFGELSCLQTLLLISNNLNNNLSDCFGNLTSLIKLDLRKNLLTDISILSNLPKLETLKCDSNLLSTLSFDLNNIAQLSSSDNPLIKFQPNQFHNLVTLNLSFGQIKELPIDLFESIPALSAFNLNNNQLSQLPSQSISKLVRLEVLQCANNRLEGLPDNLFMLPKLLQLDVHNNRIKKLPASIWFAPSLHSLNASSNALAEFPNPPNYFPPNQAGQGNGKGSNGDKPQLALANKLLHLILADNRMTEEVFSPISLLQQLQVLNLSCNDIFEVPPRGLYHLVNLTEIYLSGNSIASFPAEEIERLRHLKLFYLNCNKLSSLPAELRKLGRLVALDVGSNQLKYNISNWNYDWNWNYNKELKYLNLSGNKRLNISNASSSTNNHKDSPLSGFNDLVHLRVLGLIDIDFFGTIVDQSSNRRVRTYGSVINHIGLGLSDRLEELEKLTSWDLVVPSFREKVDECLFGLIDLIPNINSEPSKLGKYLSDWITFHFTSELRKVDPQLTDETILTALRLSFLDLQREVVTTYGEELKECASMALIYCKGDRVYLGHVGDVVAVVARKGDKGKIISPPHVPDRSEGSSEVIRVRQSGGFINPEGNVNDEVKLSRCFGLFQHLPTINANPSLTALTLSSQDELIILANRGLWEVISYTTAVEIARTELDQPMAAAQKLRDLAIAYGAQGSIMVMVIGIGDLFNKSLQLQRRRTRNRTNVAYDTQTIYQPTGSGDLSHLTQFGNWKKMPHLEFATQVPPPVGQVVICFSHIKDSKYLWEKHPDAMDKASRVHDTVLRKVLKQVGGYEVKNEGDSFMSSFSTVSSAVLWCCQVQLQLLTADWPDTILNLSYGKEVYDPNQPGQLLYKGLAISMGMNYGKPACEKDPFSGRMDYHGPMVNKSARVSGEAGWGEISISSDVLSELLNLEGLFEFAHPNSDGEVKPMSPTQGDNERVESEVKQLQQLGIKLVDLGERKLKGIEHPEPLYLVFPNALIGRSDPTRARLDNLSKVPTLNVVPSPDPNHQEPSLIELVRSLAKLCYRLECLTQPSSNIDNIDHSFLLDQAELAISDTIACNELYRTIETLCYRVENVSTSLALSLGGYNMDTVMDAIQKLLTLTTDSKSLPLLTTKRYAHLETDHLS